MAKTNAEKLQIKEGTAVFLDGLPEPIGESDERLALLEPLPANVDIVAEPVRGEVAIMFVADAASLDAAVIGLIPQFAEPRAVWLCYPKGGRADINRDTIMRRVAQPDVGWTPNFNVSLSDVWSAVRVKKVL